MPVLPSVVLPKRLPHAQERDKAALRVRCRG
jgi:hypothetical protein